MRVPVIVAVALLLAACVRQGFRVPDGNSPLSGDAARSDSRLDASKLDASKLDASRLDGVSADQRLTDGPAAGCVGEWCAIAAGTFSMGSPSDEPCREPYTARETQHTVTLTHRFELQRAEVTQDDFVAALGYNPSLHPACGTCPVDNVTWYEAAAYCDALSAKRGLAPCYDCQGNGPSVVCSEATAYGGVEIYHCPGYRLATEAEWEFAYRAGTTTAFYGAANDPARCTACTGIDVSLDPRAWYCGNNTTNHPHPVMQKQPNAWGLYDMAGNLWEWVHDQRQNDLGSAAVSDPVGTGGGSRERVMRGGSYCEQAREVRAAHRLGDVEDQHYSDYGFRVARTLF